MGFRAVQGTAVPRTRSAALTPSFPQIIGVGSVDLDRHDVAGAQRPPCRDMHGALDPRRIALAAPLRLARAALVDDDLEPPADLGRESLALIACAFCMKRFKRLASISSGTAQGRDRWPLRP